MEKFVFKILDQTQWAILKDEGSFFGSPDDLRDGFIHLSFAEQVEGTLEKHFSGRSHLLLLKLSVESLDQHLRIESSRGGQDFPHLHRSLRLTDVIGEPKEIFPKIPQ